MTETLRSRVEMAADHLGISLAELARRIGIPRPSLHRGLTNNKPTFRYLPRMAEVLGVSPDWLRSNDVEHRPIWLRSLHPLPKTISDDLVKAKIALLHAALVHAQREVDQATDQAKPAALAQLSTALAGLMRCKRCLDTGDIDGALAIDTPPSIDVAAMLAEREHLLDQVTALQAHLAPSPPLPAPGTLSA